MPTDGELDLELAPAGTYVLRGGLLGSPSRERNLRAVFEAHGLWGICAKAEPGRLPEDIAVRGKLATKTMMIGLSDELAAAGFPVVKEPGRHWPSALIVFGGGGLLRSVQPAPQDWDTLRAVMMQRPVRMNPAYKGK